MAKLNQKKIKWIIKKHKCGWPSKQISLAQGVSSSRIRQLMLAYKKSGRIPVLSKQGRKSKIVNPEIINTIIAVDKRYKIGPVALEKVLYRTRKIHIPHNTIYKVMVAHKLIKPNPNKQKQRKYVRWERKHSNSLWQGDWKQLKINGKDKWLVAFIDDASRLITCYGLFDNATTKVLLI